MTSKLGLHIDHTPEDFYWKYNEQFQTLSISDRTLADAVAFSDTPYLIVRANANSRGLPDGSSLSKMRNYFSNHGVDASNPIDVARAWYKMYAPLIEQTPKTAYWQAINEPNTRDPENLQFLNAFETERMAIADTDGWKCGIHTFSVGNPTELSEWNYLVRSLDAAHRGEHVLLLNEYWPVLAWIWYGPNQKNAIEQDRLIHAPIGKANVNWLMFRYRQVFKDFIQPRRLDNLRIVLNEIGADSIYAPEYLTEYLDQYPRAYTENERGLRKTGWWMGDVYASYMRQLEWVDHQLRLDPYVAGANIFLYTHNDEPTYKKKWERFNVRPMIERIIAHVENR